MPTIREDLEALGACQPGVEPTDLPDGVFDNLAGEDSYHKKVLPEAYAGDLGFGVVDGRLVPLV